GNVLSCRSLVWARKYRFPIHEGRRSIEHGSVLAIIPPASGRNDDRQFFRRAWCGPAAIVDDALVRSRSVACGQHVCMRLAGCNYNVGIIQPGAVATLLPGPIWRDVAATDGSEPGNDTGMGNNQYRNR